MKIKTATILPLIIFLIGAGCSNAPQNSTNDKPNAIENNSSNPSTNVVDSGLLDLSNKNLSKVPVEIFNMDIITELNLSGNNLTGALPAEIRKLKKLKILNIRNNKMTGLPAELGQLQNLEILDVSNNELTGLPYELGNLKKLKTFNLSGNNYSVQDLEKIKKALPSTNFITK